MQEEYAKQNVVFLKIDVDELDMIAFECKIDCMPTFLFFQDGNQLTKFEGASEEKVRQIIDFLIQSRIQKFADLLDLDVDDFSKGSGYFSIITYHT